MEPVEVTYTDIKNTILDDGTIVIGQEVKILHDGKEVSYLRQRSYGPNEHIPPTESATVRNAGRGINGNRPNQ